MKNRKNELEELSQTSIYRQLSTVNTTDRRQTTGEQENWGQAAAGAEVSY
jgi:hypothetical protein